MSKTLKPLGILTGVSFSLKKHNRKNRPNNISKVKFSADGTVDLNSRCGEFSLFNPVNILAAKQEVGHTIHMRLINNFNTKFLLIG